MIPLCKILLICALSTPALAQIFPPKVKLSVATWNAQPIEGYYLFVNGLRRNEDFKSPVFVSTNKFDLNTLTISYEKIYSINILATNLSLVAPLSSSVAWVNEFPQPPRQVAKKGGFMTWSLSSDPNLVYYRVYLRAAGENYDRNAPIKIDRSVNVYRIPASLPRPVYATITSEDEKGNESGADVQLVFN